MLYTIPGGPHKPGQQGPFLLIGELHDPRGLKLLPDPLALLQVINEHEFHSNVLAVGHLSPPQTRDTQSLMNMNCITIVLAIGHLCTLLCPNKGMFNQA